MTTVEVLPEPNTWDEGVQMIRDAVAVYRELGRDPAAEIDWLEHYDRGEIPPTLTISKPSLRGA